MKTADFAEKNLNYQKNANAEYSRVGRECSQKDENSEIERVRICSRKF